MIRIALFIVLLAGVVAAQGGAPGADAHWPTAAKNGFGTSVSPVSKVWFTLAGGVLTEVFYPTVDVPNVQMLQLIVLTEENVETELEDTLHRMEVPNPAALTFRQINTAKSGQYTVTKTYVTDPRRNTVLIDVEFDSRSAAGLYVYYDPSLNNSGRYDSAWTEGDALVAVDGDKSSALVSSCGSKARADSTNGYLGTSDGLTELRTHLNGSPFYPRANDGNVVQVAKLKHFEHRTPVKLRCTLALGFGETPRDAAMAARASLARGFAAIRREYEAGWRAYVSRLPRIDPKHQRQLNMAAMVLQGLEDKTFRGGSIASPSTPWGGGPNANEPNTSGYRAVWSRDLYHVATAFAALGNRAAANRALDYLFRVQQKLDGSFPQNAFVDGTVLGNGVQMDQIGLPLVLAYQLGRVDRRTWLAHVKPAADFIVRHGPFTGQDRWEEKPGYSPATIAAQIAGLVCAAEIGKLNGDAAAAKLYLEKADNWARNVERWTTTTDAQGARHYIRITHNDDPNDGAKLEINSSDRVVDERAIVDAGFLELVRLGVKAPRDAAIVQSLARVDQAIKVVTPHGDAWYRYNYDAYGETASGGKYDGRNGVGRLWTFLTGERGEYELAAGDIASARRRLETMAAFANDGLMIPEQVWDRAEAPSPDFRFGAGTGSATPLAWSMAQFIRLAMNIRSGRNLETPKVVAERYLKKG